MPLLKHREVEHLIEKKKSSIFGVLPMTRSRLSTTMVVDHVNVEGIAGTVFS